MIRSRLAAYYPFDTTHGRSATWDYLGSYPLDGGTGPTASGKVREGLSLASASSQYRSRSDAAALRQLKGCCVWVKLTTKAADMVVISKGSSAADDDQSLKLWYDQSEDKFAYTVGDNTTSTTVTTTGLTISTGTWYHIRCWNDGNRMGIAVNGTKYGTASARTPLSETGVLYIGRDVSGNYWNGQIDELALFSESPTVADGESLRNGGTGLSLPELDALPGPSGRAGFSTRWTPPSFAISDDNTLYIAHGKRRVQRFTGFGTFGSAGVPKPVTKPVMSSSGVGRILGDLYAYVRNLDADGRVSSMSPISTRFPAFGDSTGTITGATNAAPIVITSASHGLTTGDRIRITGQQGNTAANGVWYVRYLTANTFELDGSVGNGDWLDSAPPALKITTRQDGRAAVNAVQTISFSSTPSGGTFTLSFRGETSAAIAYNASAADIQTTLRAMGTIGATGVTCAGGPISTTAVTITFGGSLAGTAVPLLVKDTTNILGASVSLSVVTLTEGNAGTDEVQVLTLYGTPTGGTFTLTFSGQTTGAIAYNADAATVQTALEALSNIGVGDVTCSGGPLPGSAITMTFGGALADTNVAQMTATVTSLTGGSISASVAETTPGVSNLNNNLLSYFKLNEATGTRYASVGSGDLPEELSAVGSMSGKLGNAAAFFPSTGESLFHDSTPFAGPYSPVTGQSFTCAFWYYAPSVTPTVQNTILDLSNNFTVTRNAGAQTLTVAGLTTSALTAGAWHLIVIVYDAVAGQRKLSVNGGAFSTQSGAAVVTATSLRIGDATTTADTDQYGIDELGFWLKAFTVGDVSVLYNSGSGRTYPFPSGTSEVQTITVAGTPSQGTFTLTYGGQTATINYDDTAGEVETSLEALSSIGTDNVACGGGPLPGTPVTVTFQNDLGSTDVALMTVNDALLKYKVETTTAGSPTQSEVQRISASPAPVSGTWTATFGANTTSALAYDITASALQTALEGLASIGAGQVSVTGGPLATAPFVITFQGTLANSNVNAITTSSSLLGAPPTMTVTMTTSGLESLNEIQELTVLNALSGTFTLTYGSSTTSALDFDITAEDLETALEGIVGTGDVSVTGGPLTEDKFNIEFIGDLVATNVSEMTGDDTSLQNGGWSLGASTITYTDVETPTDTRVARRQILRNTAGQASVFYIDIDTTDTVSDQFSSTKTDEDLLSDPTLAVVLLDADGVDNNLSRHDEPPNWKTTIAAYQNRLFLAVDHVETGVTDTDSSGTDSSGVGTDWPTVFDGRTLYGADLEQAYVIDSINADTQIITRDENAETADSVGEYRIRMAQPDGQRVYGSWLTLVTAYPESFGLGEAFQISRNARDGEMTAAFQFDGRFYIGFQTSLYRYEFDTDPAAAPNGDGRMELAVPRGTISHRTVTYADDLACIMDEQGVYRFNGTTVDPISEAVKTMFTGDAARSIRWEFRKWFHCAVWQDERVLRCFVVLDGGPYPRHALCVNLDRVLWWVEEYLFPITSSCTGWLNGRQTVFLGSTGRRIYTLSGLSDGLPANSTATLRGTVTSAGLMRLTDSTAAFTSDLVGLPVKIVTGTGRGQTRWIDKVLSATALELDLPWSVTPDTTSVYQIAGIEWSIRTGMLRYTQNNENERRRVDVLWLPNTNAQTMTLRVFEDWSATAMKQFQTLPASMRSGMSITSGEAYVDLDMTRSFGHASHSIHGRRVEGVTGQEYVALELTGTTNQERHAVHAIAVTAAE